MAHDDRHLTNEQLSAFLDGQLSSQERAQIDAHLKSCEQCQLKQADLQQTVALLRALPQPSLPRSFVLPATEANVTPIARTAERGQRASIPTPPNRRQGWPRYVRTTMRAMSTIAAVLGLFFLLSSIPLLHGGATTTSDSAVRAPAVSGNGQANSTATSSPSAQTQAQDRQGTATASTFNQDNQGRQATATAQSGVAIKEQQATATAQAGATESRLHQPSATSNQPENTPSAFDLSTPGGRALWGLILLVLSILGFILLRLQHRRI